MRTRQQGVAIVLAMGVVALAALAVSAMLVAQSTWSRRIELTAGHVQAQLLIRAGLDWARAVLSDDRRASSVDHPGEPWALRLPPIPVESGSLTGQIEDQQGRFNLNNLVQDGRLNFAELAHFRRLLTILDLPPALADALAHWSGAGREPRAGAGDGYAIGPAADPAAARQLFDVADLALVRGFDDRVRARLRPFVTVLPRFTAVNVNTAPAEVIFAIIDGLSLDDARTVVTRRERAYFRDFADFFNRLPAGLVVPNESIAVGSDYFIATMAVTIGAAQARGSALLARTNTGWPAIVWRKYP